VSPSLLGCLRLPQVRRYHTLPHSIAGLVELCRGTGHHRWEATSSRRQLQQKLHICFGNTKLQRVLGRGI